jgi:hypothetical protein
MKHVQCVLCSEMLHERFRLDDPKAWMHWGVWLKAEFIEESAWRGLADWVVHDSRRSALDALSVLLNADLPWSPTTEQLIEVRQDLARVEVEGLNGHPRAAFDKLVGFLDLAIRHAKDCEGNPRRRSSTNFRWHGEN